MSQFEYRDNTLYAENVAVDAIVEAVDTPCYVYSRAALEQHWQAYDKAFGDHPHLICYAVKANSNLAVLNVLAKLGAGFDIVSQGELERVLRAGGDPGKVVFSGVGKQPTEMARALEVGVYCFNVESEAELETLNKVAAQLGKVAPVSFRVNPDVDAQTHPYISTGLKENKFGIDIDRAITAFERAAELPNVDVVGIDCHIGSQLTNVTPFMDALERLFERIDQLKAKGINIKHLDIGGGLGVTYRDEQPPSPGEYVKALLQKLGQRDLTVVMEPGRSIAANAGIMVTRVELLKSTEVKQFAVVDAAMNDMIRPSLYSAWQAIIPVNKKQGATQSYDVVGPICETGDFLGKDRELNIEPGDLLAVCSAGAYGFVMSSNYNTRNRCPEIMVDDTSFYTVRRRETYEDQLACESLIP